jgi:hypothetical protein
MAILPQLGQLAVNRHLYGNHATETPLPVTNAKGVIVYPGFPADVLFNFRLYSIAAQLVLWGAIGLIFAPLADRLLAPGPARAELRQAKSFDPESVVGRNIHPYTNIDDLEMDDKGEPLRTVYTWPRVIETPDVTNSESSESIEPLQMSLLKAARVRH